MNARQFLRLGILFLAVGAVGGCSTSQSKPAISSQNKKTLTPQVAGAQEPLAEPQWQTPGVSAPDLLAQKTSAYASSLQGTNPGDRPAQSDSPAALFNDSSGHHHKSEVVAPVPAAAVAAPAVEPPVALASLAIPPKPAVVPDEPKIMPESADFSALGTSSKETLGDRLRKRTRENPADVADQLDLQLYGMLNDDPSPELAEVTLLAADDRELVSALVDGLSNFRSAIRQDSTMLQAKKIQPLLEMADRLRSQADLAVSTVVLCRRVDGFGKYEPIAPARFTAGKENAVIVYCEVENFLSKQNTQQIWQTRLSETVTLYTDTGMMAWNGGANQVADDCRNRRHDFFAYNIIKLPSNLTVGRYMLKVSVEDLNAGRVAETTVPLSIGAK